MSRRGRRGAHFARLLLGGAAFCSCSEEMVPREDPVFPDDFMQSYTRVADSRFSNPHPAVIEVYCSPEGAADYLASSDTMPEGTVLVKAIYNDLDMTDLFGYVAMLKQAPGTAPSSRDWYWQELDEDRNVLSSGAVQSCIACHSSEAQCPGAAAQDWTCIDSATRPTVRR